MRTRLTLLQAVEILERVLVADFAQVKAKALLALVARSQYGRHLAAGTLDSFLGDFARFHKHLNTLMSLVVVATHLYLLQVCLVVREETVLAEAELIAVGADEAGAYDRFHVACDTLLVVVEDETVRKLLQLKQFEFVIVASFESSGLLSITQHLVEALLAEVHVLTRAAFEAHASDGALVAAIALGVLVQDYFVVFVGEHEEVIFNLVSTSLLGKACLTQVLGRDIF